MRIWIVGMLFSVLLVPNSVNAQEFSYKIDTYLPWHLQEDKTLAIVIMADASIDPEKINAVKSIILSEKTFSKNDITFYEGWYGALIEASRHTTTLTIPSKFIVSDSTQASGDIIIKLTNQQSSQGYSGYTKLVTIPGQILKSFITIYDVNKLSNTELSAVIRHEFGHAMGLGHATNPDDLMHGTIQKDDAYVSGCDIEGLVALYDGNKLSETTCA